MSLKRLIHIPLRRPTRLGWFLFLSLLVHVFFLFHSKHEPQPFHFQEQAPVEITQLSPQEAAKLPAMPKREKKEPEVAESEKVPNLDLDPNATFLSDHNQRVQQETKAAQVDDFRKKEGTGLKNSLSRSATPPPTGDPEKAFAKDSDLDALSPQKSAGVKRNWKKLTLKDLGIGGDGGVTASTDDQLKGVRESDQTVLSTREFKFYSYYHRIKETLRQYWKPNVERRLAMLWHRGARMKDAELVTQVLVLLDEKGTLTRITRVTSSGFSDLDEAAMEAFNQAAPFPNPPTGMIDKDGLVRIRWDFILKTEASPQISFRSGGAPPPSRRMP
jgi:protein TonB